MKSYISTALQRIGRALFPFGCAAAAILLCEWCARGALDTSFWTENFSLYWRSYLLAALLLTAVWYALDALLRFAPLNTFVIFAFSIVLGTVDRNTLQLRGEPFLPWDLAQISEAKGVVSAAGVILPSAMLFSLVFACGAAVWSWFLYRGRRRRSLRLWLLQNAAATAWLAVLLFGIYLQPAATETLGIYADAWMQDRYYRNYGVITGFITNLTNLEINKPDDYSEEAVRTVLAQTQANASDSPVFDGCYAQAEPNAEKTPTIIYVMDESYWDVSELESLGVTFDTDVSANLHRLQQTSASGRSYSPSFGGGTCDVEFEALTGYSKEFLPSGSKPFQQHVTHSMFALPGYLQGLGYETAAIHCFYAKYWSRDTAYPNLGFSDFISLEDMIGLHARVRSYYWKNGLVTDADMAEQVISEYEKLSADGSPVFLHAVTMQNHTNYNAANYPDDQLVHVTSAPAGISASTIGALEDFATGIKAADDMLGTLTDYFQQVDEPVILVFWGDHYNPIDSNYTVYTSTGYASDASSDPALHATTLLIWSNYYSQPVDIGTVAAYEITPVMMDLYGLDKPVYYEYLTQQLSAYRSRSCGVTVEPDGTTSTELTDAQKVWYENHRLLQYDLMFGKEYTLSDAA